MVGLKIRSAKQSRKTSKRKPKINFGKELVLKTEQTELLLKLEANWDKEEMIEILHYWNSGRSQLLPRFYELEEFWIKV